LLLKSITLTRYNTNHASNWNQFITDAANGTFLFHRDFMEYHADRFEDFSLMIFEEDHLIALLPAHQKGEDIFSHMGLTYGGLVWKKGLKLATLLIVFQKVLKFLHENQYKTLTLKIIPEIYSAFPAQDLMYVVFTAEARLIRRDALAVIDLKQPIILSKDRKEGVKRAEKNHLVFKETQDFESFWNTLLIPMLEQKHQTQPVHSLQEILQLKEQFPKHIRLYAAYLNEVMIAGTVLFVTTQVVHSQYIASKENKNETGSLDGLHHYLLTQAFPNYRWFDFGISNEENGKKLNQGLSYWKQSFGAHTMIQDVYTLDTSNFNLLNDVLI
jgi:hypothetical protein